MKALKIGRREFVRRGVSGFALFAAGGLSAVAAERGVDQSSLLDAIGGLADLGPLLPADANGVRLPVGFTSRIVARSGERPAPGSAVVWHEAPDGGAVFPCDDGGWVYVSNCEVRGGAGGVGALRFDAQGTVVDCYKILENTSSNCAGGATPWGTWLSCEEYAEGLVFECDPQKPSIGVARPLLGRFPHEAVAVDLAKDQLYLTEDQPDGGFYRFSASRGLPDLSAGELEIAAVIVRDDKQFIEWHKVPDPLASSQPTRHQVPEAERFRGGEGIALHDGVVYFTTKRDNRVWAYHVGSQELRVLYDVETAPNPILSGVDNVTVTPAGDVLVAEDGGDMQLVVLSPNEEGVEAIALLQVVGHDSSEITGPAFDPSYTRLYFSSQTGTTGNNDSGVTFEISRVLS